MYLNKKEVALWLRNNYENNPCQFILDFTKLFYDLDGTFNEPYYKQALFMNGLRNEDKVITVLKSRQCGISTAIVGLAVHQAFFGKYPEIMIISATKEMALKVMDRVRKCFRDMPEFIRPDLAKDSSQKIELGNGVKVVALSSNPKGMHGWTGLWLWDEVTKFSLREQYEIWEAVYPSITKTGKIIMVSTPESTEGLFYEFCTKTLKEITGNDNIKNEIRKFLIHWKDVPHIVKAVKFDGLFDPLEERTIEREYELHFRNEDEEEQFFKKDFLLTYFRDPETIEIPHFTSYIDLGIPHQFASLEYLKSNKIVSDVNILENLLEMFDEITAGWDIASTSNDSVLSVAGKLKNSNVRYRIGKFLLNRVGNGFHDTDIQIKYLRNIKKVMSITRLNIDGTGLGIAVRDNIKNNYPELASIMRAYDYKKDIDKISCFSDMKTLMINNLYKRKWNDSKECAEDIKQYTNLRLNKLNNSLSAKGDKKDDIPNADMLSLQRDKPVQAKITLI